MKMINGRVNPWVFVTRAEIVWTSYATILNVRWMRWEVVIIIVSGSLVEFKAR